MNQEHFVLREEPIEALVRSRQTYLLGLATDPSLPPSVPEPVPVPTAPDEDDDDDDWDAPWDEDEEDTVVEVEWLDAGGVR